MRGADRALWEEALEQKLASINANGTWEPARLPPRKNGADLQAGFQAKAGCAGQSMQVPDSVGRARLSAEVWRRL